MPRTKTTRSRNGNGSVYEATVRHRLKDGTMRERVVYVAELQWTSADGIEQRRSAQRSSRKAAAAMLERFLVERAGGTVTTAEQRAITVGEAVENWLDEKEAHVRKSTMRLYRIVQRHLSPLEHVRVATLTRAGVRACVERAELSPRVRHLSSVILKASLRPYLRLVSEDLFPPRTTPRAQHRSMNVWTVQQANVFLAYTHGDRFGLLWQLALSTGMRQGEILRLRWGDVHESWIEVKGETKTAGSRRRITIDAGLAAALEDRRGKAGEYVFATASGKPISSRNIVRAFKAAIDKVQEAEAKKGEDGTLVPEIRFHDLRHTHATALLRADVHPKVVAERLGHASVKLTLDTYSHAIPTMQTAAAAIVGDLFGQNAPSKSPTKSPTRTKLRAVG